MAVNKGMKILIVDDARTMLQIIKGQFMQLGFNNLDLATDGQMALAKIKESKFDLVISDWNMEPMNGIDLLRAIRANPETQAMPVILITAESKVENVVEAKKAGVNNYIIKPFNPVTLKEKLVAVIGAF
jgi:two-component system chemotaxis response regulator CheY